MAGIDDTYLLGQPNIVIPIVPIHKAQLNKVSLDFNDTKNEYHIDPAHHNSRLHCMLGEMDESMLQTQDRHPVYGMKIYRIPTGDADFIKEALSMKATKIRLELKQIETRLYPAVFTELQPPDRYCVWLLTMRCLQHLGNYLCHNVSPQLTLAFIKSFDKGICELVTTSTDTAWISTSAEAKEYLQLP
eukprot:8123159-Ditylum_brightwellii.AAC.1